MPGWFLRDLHTSNQQPTMEPTQRSTATSPTPTTQPSLTVLVGVAHPPTPTQTLTQSPTCPPTLTQQLVGRERKRSEKWR